MNRIGAIIASLGITSHLMVSLEVMGRHSGHLISLPLVIVYHNERRYLVSMLGANVQWVKNVMASQGKAILRSGIREQVVLHEIPIDQRAPILKAYLQRAPGARPYISVKNTAPLADFERIAANYPVFEVLPASETASM